MKNRKPKTPKLLPCPCCDGTNLRTGYTVMLALGVQCMDCGLAVYRPALFGLHGESAGKHAQAAAIKAWNTRPGPKLDAQKMRQLSKELTRRLRFLKAKYGKDTPPLGEFLELTLPIIRIAQNMPSVIAVKACK